MRIERHTDPAAYAALVTPQLLRDEARYNLELAILHRIAGGEFPDAVLLTVDGAPALMTPPYNLIMQTVPAAAAPELAGWLHAAGVAVPGVLAAPEAATAFAERHAALTGRRWRVVFEQGVYQLRELLPPAPVPGTLRQATPDDGDLVVAWCAAFAAEVHVPLGDEGRFRDRITLESGGFWLWEDGGPVALAGCGGLTPNGARIGPVYTPPEHRGRGYGTAVTAGATRVMLEERGRTCAFLYTDLANPTSNKIYQSIGYRHVTDVRQVEFSDG